MTYLPPLSRNQLCDMINLLPLAFPNHNSHSQMVYFRIELAESRLKDQKPFYNHSTIKNGLKVTNANNGRSRSFKTKNI